MGVANSRFSSAAKSPFYDRGTFHTNVSDLTSFLAIAPHGRTLRMGGFAVPADRIAYIQGGTIRCTRITAAAPAATVYISFELATNQFVMLALLSSVDNAIGSSDVVQIPPGSVARPGATGPAIFTRDSSTGGTVSYFMAVAWLEFAV